MISTTDEHKPVSVLSLFKYYIDKHRKKEKQNKKLLLNDFFSGLPRIFFYIQFRT